MNNETQTHTGRPPKNVNVLERIREFSRFTETRQILDRILRAQAQAQGQPRAIAILSESAGEGKTLLAAALAVGYSDLGRTRALVIDAATPGLRESESSLRLDRALEADELSGPGSPIRRTLSVQVDLLSLAEWTENSPGGLPETRVSEIVSSLAPVYGLILFDTTALGSKNRDRLDPLAVARRCDSSIIVISRVILSQSTYGDGLHAIQDRLRRERLPLLGVVHNEGI
jgi:hypothetical protein